ncbi:unnamed protein product, partial [Ectocarpus sp. 12 AP-2014]
PFIESHARARIRSSPAALLFVRRLMETDGDGNLCWQAAFEQEIASLAVGIRSFPKEGLNAEKYLRDAYIAQLTRLGGQV